MTYEKEIPDYAMVPAKEIEERIIIPVTKGAIYSPVQVTNITEKPETIITIEEDLLVPDTKPDLREILLIDGKARLAFREIEPMSKGEDNINLAGDVELQTLYLPENRHGTEPVIAVQTRVPFKDRWHISAAPGATMTLDCAIEKIDYMVINERKYRVKISIAVKAREYSENKVEVFEGITGEELQMLKEKIQITNIAMRKKDTITISQALEIKEECTIENILKQDISVVENYKQLTGEKMVINGFVYVNLLYTVKENHVEESSREDCSTNIRQAQERVEFTQFIPLQGANEFSGSNINFDSSGLRVKLVSDEEQGEVLRLEGEIMTHAELYRNVEKEIIVDAYHKEKDFICDFKEEKCRTMVGSAMGESTVREIITPDAAYGDLEKIIYTTAQVSSCRCHCEQGKVITEGLVAAKMVCQGRTSKDEEPQIFSVRQEVPFHIVIAAARAEGGEMVNAKIHIKDIWAEKINGKQIEFNGTAVVNAEIMEETPFKVLVNPAFEQQLKKTRPVPMVVYVTGENDDLWSIAKKFKTSVETISQVNQLGEENPAPGRKLLILK